MNEPKSLTEVMQEQKELAEQEAKLESMSATVKEQPQEEIMIGQEGEPQLSKSALELDGTTPGSSMSNLTKFNESLDAEMEAAKAEREEYEKNKVDEVEEEEEEAVPQFKDEIIDVEEETTGSKEVVPDLSTIRIVKPKNLNETFTGLMAKRKSEAYTTKVILPVSGYTASLIGMSSPEIRNFSATLNSLDRFGYMDAKYKNLHEKITETSIGDLSYETFLKRTALMEYEILNYGLFASSFPDKNTYPVNCPSCTAPDSFVYNNKQFLQLNESNPERKRELTDALLGVIKGQAIDPKKLFEDAETNKLIRKYLKYSKMIVELRHPTLYDQLYDVVQNVTEELTEKNEAVVNLMPFIAKVYYPTPETVDNEAPEYYELEDVNKKIMAINILNEEDDTALSQAIKDEILDKYKVKYALQPPKCRVCGHQIPAEEVSFDNMLFMMHQIRITKK